MSGFLRSLLTKVSGIKLAKNKHPVNHIEGAEIILVDSSIFCCPICYSVYASVPVVLQCGHTFCGACIKNISMRENLTTVVNNHAVFFCPLCRETCSAKKLVKNYLIEDVLQQIATYSPEEDITKAAVATVTLAKQRLENRCKELEQQNNRMHNEFQEHKKREMKNYIAIKTRMEAQCKELERTKNHLEAEKQVLESHGEAMEILTLDLISKNLELGMQLNDRFNTSGILKLICAMLITFFILITFNFALYLNVYQIPRYIIEQHCVQSTLECIIYPFIASFSAFIKFLQ